MAENKQMYTPQGYQELVDELEYLRGKRREEIREQIAVARGFGDLSENAEYDEARNEQAKVEARIKELETLVENAVVVDENVLDASIVSLGSVVHIHDDDEDEDLVYYIVGSNEVSPVEHKISDMSPIGHALMGKRKGDKVVVEVPMGELHFTVTNVDRANKKD
ncbi:MAG: transcription elongation factor GreA [Clostridia bacterium]|nr:transcription elongation factor GreA [Clostridia bacterium]